MSYRVVNLTRKSVAGSHGPPLRFTSHVETRTARVRVAVRNEVAEHEARGNRRDEAGDTSGREQTRAVKGWERAVTKNSDVAIYPPSRTWGLRAADALMAADARWYDPGFADATPD
jgi:hypothetical protein